MEQATAFLKQLYSDTTLQAKADDTNWSASAAVEIAAEAGYTITVEELRAAQAVLQQDLSDDELSNIAGAGIHVF